MAMVSNRMPLRMLSERLAASRLARLSSSGKVFSEEEKAAENVYIKKMEQEKIEKLARQGHKPEGQKSASDGTPGSQSSESVSRDKTKNYAIVAGVVAVATSIWWYTSSKPKEKEHA
ncbi:hypothetical protein SUGI_0370950 [Cryptomeria japonica]|uniref:uncharacterized protein At2g27730, mitochondrial n=1 Tax=Cryptomeria japonica TaxID=3369 RepID=UPI002408EDEB|nr:uncharacterized protein At2g27730, mitochondrial [Cryptomeria japonica]GLJ20422.1 hypothetical protein SUGI_0370950 [Cryptomeria japonica]